MRLFIGLPMSEDLQRRLERARSGIRGAPGETRPIDPNNWHITVAFLGHVDAENLPALKTLFHKATNEPPGGSFFIHEFRTFPPKHPSYIVAHAVPENHTAWKTYIMHLRDMLSLVAPQIDRKPWVPHISVGRTKKRTALPPWSHPIQPIIWKPERISVVESLSTQDGSVYRDIYDIPLNI